MKVDKVVVLVLHSSLRTDIDVRSADVRDGFTLATKHIQRHGKEEAPKWEAVANGAGFEVAGHTGGQIGKHNALLIECEDGVAKKESGSLKAFLSDAKTFGIYIIMHGQDGLPTPFIHASNVNSPEQIAKLINGIFSSSQSVLKINIVGCTLARAPKIGVGGKKAKKARTLATNEGSWAAALCKKLKRKETMVAAYTNAVYIIRDNNPEFKTFGAPDTPLPEGIKFGQKAVDVGIKDIDMQSVKAHRTQVKKIYQYSGGFKSAVNEIDHAVYHAYGRQ